MVRHGPGTALGARGLGGQAKITRVEHRCAAPGKTKHQQDRQRESYSQRYSTLHRRATHWDFTNAPDTGLKYSRTRWFLASNPYTS